MKRLTPQPKPGHQAKRKPAKALLPYCYEYPRPAVAVSDALNKNTTMTTYRRATLSTGNLPQTL